MNSFISLFLQEKIFRSETNREQLLLKRVTQMLISTDDDLMEFGLYPGFTYDMVVQKRTNNPGSIEGAAMDLACHWWKYSNDSFTEKKRQLLLFCLEIKKAHLVSNIAEILGIPVPLKENSQGDMHETPSQEPVWV